MKQVIAVNIERKIEGKEEIEWIANNPKKVEILNNGIESAVKKYFVNILDLPKETVINVEIKVVE